MYNAEKTVESALESIQKQTYSNLEIICVNDGSDDETLSIVERRAKFDKRIKPYSHEHRGIVYALNKSIELSQGKYLARMDADDIAFLDRIEKQVRYMESNPDVVASGTAVEIFNARGISRTTTPHCNPEILRYRMIRIWPIAHSSLIVHHTALLDNDIRYSKEHTYVEDLKLYFDLSRIGKLGNLPDTLLAYRAHPNQISKKNYEILRERELQLRADIYKSTCEDHSLNPERDSPGDWRRKVPRNHDAIWVLLWYTITHNTKLTKLKKLRLVLFTHLRLTAKPRLVFYIFFKNRHPDT